MIEPLSGYGVYITQLMKVWAVQWEFIEWIVRVPVKVSCLEKNGNTALDKDITTILFRCSFIGFILNKSPEIAKRKNLVN